LESDRAGSAEGRARRGHLALVAAATLALWLHRFDPPVALRGVGVGGDTSWILANVVFALKGAQCGVDWVLTCGPLGLVERGSFHPATFWPVVLLWNVLFELGSAATLALLVLRLPSWVGRALGLVLLLLLDGFLGARALLLMLGATLLALDARRWKRLSLLWALLLLSCYATVKANYLWFALPCAIALVLDAQLRIGAIAALRRVALGAAVFFLVWTAILHQAPGNVVDYLRNAWQISVGYGEALSQPAPERLIALALSASAAALAGLALNARGWRSDARRALSSALAALGLFLAFKMSFVRHGGADTFFAYGAQLPVLAWGSHLSSRETSARPRGSHLVLVALVASFAFAFAGVKWLPGMIARRPLVVASGQLDRLRINLGVVADLPGFAARQARALEEARAEHDLPRVRAALDGRPVDLLGVEQAVLILNGFAWRPRPVFQGYHTYTPALRALNLSAFLRPDFARHFLIKPYDLGEGHFPHLDEPDLLRLIARDFRPLLEEGGFLLVERAAPARGLDPALGALVERDVAPGEWIELPQAGREPRVLFVDWPWTAAGRALGFLYHSPQVVLVCELEDGSQVRGRITPTVARDGMLLDPLLANLEDWRAWYAGESGRRVRRLALEIEPWAGRTLPPRAHVRVAVDGTGRP
jgi:hypothetical protein